MSGARSPRLHPSRKQRAHLVATRPLALEVRGSSHIKLDDALRFAFSIIVNGANFKTIQQVLLWNDIVPPSKTTFYRAQGELFPILSESCRSECAKWRAEMSSGTIISFDGSWSHRRNAKECVVVVIDCLSKKVVDYEILFRAKRGLAGNYQGSANGMEVAALRILLGRWANDPKVIGYVHDNDGASAKAIRDAEWNIPEYLDPNHMAKQFDRKWQKLRPTHLRGFQNKVKMWFNYLIRSDYTMNERETYWMNTVEHFLGNHAQCPGYHPDLKLRQSLVGNQAGVNELKVILEKTLKLIQRA